MWKLHTWLKGMHTWRTNNMHNAYSDVSNNLKSVKFKPPPFQENGNRSFCYKLNMCNLVSCFKLMLQLSWRSSEKSVIQYLCLQPCTIQDTSLEVNQPLTLGNSFISHILIWCHLLYKSDMITYNYSAQSTLATVFANGYCATVLITSYCGKGNCIVKMQ